MKHKKSLPTELIDNILSFVPKQRLPVTMRVSKTWYQSAKRLCYRKICFNSVNQREAFFAMLEDASLQGQSTSPIKSARSSSRSRSPSSPPAVVLRRKGSLRNYNRGSEISKLIYSLDFGLRPKEFQASEPQLPMTRAVPPPPQRQKPPPLFVSPSAVKSLDSPIRSTTSVILDTPLTRRSPRLATFQSPSKSTTKNDSRTNSTSPVRQRVGAGLSISTIGSALTDSDSTISSPYGTWAHRFVSPLVPKIGIYIPNLKELSLCGCHVNAQDFGSVLQATRLIRLDISYSTLKTDGVQLISRYCKTALQYLNLSGIFKLGRNRSHGLVGIAMHCTDLTKIVALDCPEIYPEVLNECEVLSNGRIKFEMEDNEGHES
jgi:F-box-like